MGCINPDGIITESARTLLKIIKNPLTSEEISKHLGQPLFKIRISIREMQNAGLLKEENDKYIITEKGKERV